MAYDRLLESERLIAHGVPDVPFRLSRRRRFIPVGVDVVGDVAATMFIRRGVSGNPWLETWALERRNGAWVVLGGGGADGYEQLFDRRDGIGDICVIHGVVGRPDVALGPFGGQTEASVIRPCVSRARSASCACPIVGLPSQSTVSPS